MTGNSADVGAAGFKAGTWGFGYDANGNMTSDNSKGITGTAGVTYNLLNLPQSIVSKNINYTYDAGGKKLKNVTESQTTDYIDGIQYVDNVISFIQTEEGRAIPNGPTAYNYEYSLTDHLGNSRVHL